MGKLITKATIPNRILELRKKNGLTQQELAERLFIGDNTVSRIEHGEFLTLDTLMRIADIFGVSLDYIVYRSNTSENNPLTESEGAIMAELKSFTEAEKERLLKHLILENSLKTANDR